MVAGIRKVEVALGHGRKIPAESEQAIAQVARRSLTAAAHIPVGTTITRELITLKRPGTGLKPAELGSLIGRVALVDIPAGSLLTIEMFG
jgi:sialic acid synthase SpsE